MKTFISLFLLSLILITSVVNAQSIGGLDNANIEQYQHAHSTNQAMSGDMDCCSDGVHANCSSVTAIDVPVVVSQEIAKNIVLLIPAFDAAYASFVSKIPTPPPAV